MSANQTTGDTEAPSSEHTHIRAIGAWRHNLCPTMGGQATWPSDATCPDCRSVYAGSGDSQNFPSESPAVTS